MGLTITVCFTMYNLHVQVHDVPKVAINVSSETREDSE